MEKLPINNMNQDEEWGPKLPYLRSADVLQDIAAVVSHILGGIHRELYSLVPRGGYNSFIFPKVVQAIQ